MNEVFAFEWTRCIFEGAFGIVSLHTTKRGAFKAMVVEANRKWQEDRNSQLMYGGGIRPRHSPLSYEAWRVIRIEVSNVELRGRAFARSLSNAGLEPDLTTE